MKKNLIIIGVVMTAPLCGSPALAQQRQTSPVTLAKISENVYVILGGRGARGGLYIGDNGVLVIDSKMDKDSVDQTIAQIKVLTDKPIRYLVNTHSDGDHVAGNRYFPDTVTFVAHENCRKDFFRPTRSGAPSQWGEPDLMPFVPSVTFKAKMDIHLGSKPVQLWHFGAGHTTGDTVVYIPEAKTAFLGDQIFLTRPQLIHAYKGGNSFEHVKTLAKMLDTLDAETFCSGHSDIADRRAITQHIRKVKDLQAKAKSLVGQNKSLNEIKGQFAQDEARLVEVVYNELTARR